MRIALLLSLLMSITASLSAQSILINADGGTPDPSSFLEIRSTEKGFLPPRMTAAQRLAISSAAQGLLVFQTDGTVGYYFYNGTAWDTLGGATTVTNVSNITNVSNSGIAVIRDIKNSGVDGGTFASGSWVKRDLNDIAGDTSFVYLDTASKNFTLDTGTYVITIIAPANFVKTNQVRLYNSTDTMEEAVGTTSFANQFANSYLTAVIKVTGTSKTFEVQHQCSDTRNGNGFGIAVSWGQNVYTQVQIEQL